MPPTTEAPPRLTAGGAGSPNARGTKTVTTTAPNAAGRQSFLDNLVADLRAIRASDYWVGMSAFGGKADMTILRGACPLLWSLLGVKQTLLVALHTSAYDPKQTFCRAQTQLVQFYTDCPLLRGLPFF
jgi:hypothetical protein